MSFDPALYEAPATKGDLAGVAISVSMALDFLVSAMAQIQTENTIELNATFEKIKEQSDRLDSLFDELTGWRR